MSKLPHPQIYDPAIDEWRDVMQCEVDELVKISKKYGLLRVAVYTLMNKMNIIQDPQNE
jgi:hypothetical protein